MTLNDESRSIDKLVTLLGDASRVSTAEETISAHSYDAWPVAVKQKQANERPYAPDIVVSVRTTEEVSKVLSFANEKSIPVTAWGLGSSVVGAPLAIAGGICLDTSMMDQLIEIDERNSTVTAEAGMIGGHLESVLNERGLTLNFSPQSLHRSSIGGWVATRATGQFSSKYGGIEEALVAVEVVLANGEVVQSLKLPRMSVGLKLNDVFIGSEGCFGIVTKVTLRIYPVAETQIFSTIDFPDVTSGVDVMREIMIRGVRPFLLRFYDLEETRFVMRNQEYPNPVMFLGTSGVKEVAEVELAACVKFAEAKGGRVVDNQGTENWMGRRFDFSAVENVLGKPGGVAETIEISHDWDGIVRTHALLKEKLRVISKNVLGHFSHAYVDGVSLYIILVSEEETLEDSRRVIDDIWRISMEGALETGASIAHHHGVGLARDPYVVRSLGNGHKIIATVKAALDPKGILNPGKLGLRR
jgi:alkyldihydroxyacetonephosphate synthase